MLGALVGYLIHKNWHRAWVRGVTTFTGTFIGGWIVTFIGTAIVAALVDQNNNGTDTGPIMVWTGIVSLVVASLVALAFVRHTPQRTSTASRSLWTPGGSATSSRRGANPCARPDRAALSADPRGD